MAKKDGMKDLLRFLIYGGGAALVIGLLSLLATGDLVSPDALVAISVLLVIVLPVIFGVMLGRRERLQRDKSPE
ncbi:MAG: hypothetical protein IPK65_05010 [Gammaproteobacteria bacterium]|nr:hypothetical protein [Gammaproteobacteria bacterium]